MIATCVERRRAAAGVRPGGAAHHPADGGPAPAPGAPVPLDQLRDVPRRRRVPGPALPHSALLPGRRGLSALQSGLSTFPEAFGVMIGAQFASRFIYPRIGPRRHITGGLLGLAALHARC